MKTALIVAPHPDDAELGMGGAIVKMITAGCNVIVVDLTDGEPTPLGSKKIRATESLKASKILGIKQRICLNMPNRRLESNWKNKIMLAEVIRLNKPDILFAPATPDWHPDHKSALELTEAARFEAKYHHTDMAGQPHWTPKLWLYYSPHRREYLSPSVIVDISDEWELKLAAVKAYQSQLKNTKSNKKYKLIENIRITAAYFGQCINCRFGEPLISTQPLSIHDMNFFPGL
jgi:N-acetylglucosamine malate deacetylase 1